MDYEKYTDRELMIHEIHSHLEGIIDKVERMTSGNFMHSKNAIRFSAYTIIRRLNELGLKDIDSL